MQGACCPRVPASCLKVAVCVSSHEPIAPMFLTPFKKHEINALSQAAISREQAAHPATYDYHRNLLESV